MKNCLSLHAKTRNKLLLDKRYSGDEKWIYNEDRNQRKSWLGLQHRNLTGNDFGKDLFSDNIQRELFIWICYKHDH